MILQMNLRLLCALLFSAAAFAQQPVDFGKSTLVGKVKQTETRVYIAE